MQNVKRFLREKKDRGIEKVQVTTMLRMIEQDEKETRAQQEKKSERQARAAQNGVEQPTKLDLVGTREAAEILGVERPRIGRWLKTGVMPEPVARTKSGPVWFRSQITGMRGERKRRRRKKAAAA